MLGVKVTFQDIEAIDPDYYKNLQWMLEVGRQRTSGSRSLGQTWYRVIPYRMVR